MKRCLMVVLSWAFLGCATTPVVDAEPKDAEPEVLEEFTPEYPSVAKGRGVSGTVVLKVHLDALGNVTQARVLEGPDSGLHEAAIGAIHRFRFKPALKNGEPVAFTLVYRFTFMR